MALLKKTDCCGTVFVLESSARLVRCLRVPCTALGHTEYSATSTEHQMSQADLVRQTGIGPDRLSYGFVYQPNKKGTPIGTACYDIYKLSHDWYWFHASDDGY